MRIQKHTELEIYKKAQDAAMDVFHASKTFPKRYYSLPARYGGRRVQFREHCRGLAPTALSRRPSWPSYRMPRAKPPRRRCGSNLL